jgi:hypothetical protein
MLIIEYEHINNDTRNPESYVIKNTFDSFNFSTTILNVPSGSWLWASIVFEKEKDINKYSKVLIRYMKKKLKEKDKQNTHLQIYGINTRLESLEKLYKKYK